MLPFKRAKKGLSAAFLLTTDKGNKENDGLLTKLYHVRGLKELKHRRHRKNKGQDER
jgi:hypothetical protein